MNRLLCPALLLVILSAGCRRPAEPETPAGRVRLELFPRSLTKGAIVFDYRLTNRLRGAIYFICPDPACSSDTEYGAQLPFYELNESSVLAVSSYHARKPFTELSDPYEYELIKVEPGDTYSGHVSLAAPYVTNRPYPAVEYKPEIIWSPMIDRIRLTIGYFVCPGTETGPECSAPAETDLARYDQEDTSGYLDCGSDEGDIVPQHLISAEGGIGHTGDWPDRPRWRGVPWLDESEESMDDAGEVDPVWSPPKFIPYWP